MNRSTVSKILRLSGPIIGLNLLHVLTLAVDTAMVGRLKQSEEALAGLGYAGQIVFLLMVGMIGLTVGAVAFVSRAHGSKAPERVNHILHQSVQLTIVLGVICSILGNVIASPLLVLLGAEDASIALALEYLRPMLLGIPFYFLNILYAAILRGVENTRLAFFVAVILNGLNILFNYCFILGNFGLPQLGMFGAAIGTVMANFLAVCLMLLLLKRGSVVDIRPQFSLSPIDKPLFFDLLRVGWPAAGDMIILNASFLTIIGLLGMIDPLAVAAHAVGIRIWLLAFVPGMSVSQATTALVGNALGASNTKEAKSVVKVGIILCATIMSVLGFVVVLFSGPLIQLFNIHPDSELFKYAGIWLLLLGSAMPALGIWLGLEAMFHGSGMTNRGLRINFYTTICIQIPISYLMGITFGWGLWGVWGSFPLVFILKFLWGALEYREGKWLRTGMQA